MKIKGNLYNLFVNLICIVLLIGIFIYLLLNWGNIPDKISGHYNAIGEIDKMINKVELFVLPIIGLFMYLCFTIIGKFPQLWNTGVVVTEENKEYVFRNLKNMLNTLKLIMVAVFVYITINSSQARNMTVWFIPIFLSFVFGTIIYFSIKLKKVNGKS